LASKDVVRIYDSAIDGRLLGFATVSNGLSEVDIKITQIGSLSGSVYISVTSLGKFESIRTKADFNGEIQ
jgi:hypothetical protein